MKAAYIERHGGPEVLQFGEMPDPVAAPGEVVVDIAAASVNGADWKVREGKSGQLSRFPYILGRDFSGVVSAVGDGVTDLHVGDEVFAVCDVGQEGAYAEKIAIKAAIACSLLRPFQRTRKTSLPRKWRDSLTLCAATASLSR